MILERIFIRNQDFGDLFEDFFISAVVSILGIRLFLSLTHYPQFGGQGLHIAHMLWGGFFMMISIMLLLTILGNSIKRIGAILGGIGFGTFIDELGKFITSDNNYFYQPTIALIYIIFVLFYLLFRLFRRYVTFSQHEYLINSLELMTEAVVHDLDSDEKAKAQYYLNKADKDDPIALAVQKLFETIKTIPQPKPNPLIRFERVLKNWYLLLIQQKWFINILILFFIFQSIVGTIVILFSFIGTIGVVFQFRPIADAIDLFDILNLLINSITGLFVILGVLQIRKKRLFGYKLFKWSILISIFFVQVLSFYQNQLSAFSGLLFNVVILFSLNFMIERENNLQKTVSIYT